MLPELNGIRLTAGAGLGLRPGETVALEVVRRMGGQRWEVSLGGRRATVWSPVDLVPGGSLRARVQRAGDPVSGAPALLKLAASSGPALLDWLRQAGLPPDALSQRIVAALLDHRAPLDPQWIARLRRAVVGGEPAEPRRLRLLVLLLDRGLDLQEAGTEGLLALLDGDGWRDPPGSGGRQPEERHPAARHPPGGDPAGELAGLLKDAIDRAGGEGQNPLQLFNHLRAGHGQWLVVPFRLSGRGTEVDGRMRLLLDPHQGTVRRFVLEAGTEGEEPWAFDLNRDPGRPWRLRVIHGGGRRTGPGAEPFAGLGKKLHNLGVEVDDTLIEYRDFDGFSLAGDALTLRGIDTVR